MLTELQAALRKERKCFVKQVCRSLTGMNRTKNYACESLTVLLHKK